MIFSRYLILSLMGVLLLGCGNADHSGKSELKTGVAEEANADKTLYFTGSIQPLYSSSVSIPMDAVIETIHYHYGQHVNKNDVIAVLSSAELQRQYNETLTDYLKAKDNFTVTQAKFTGTQHLWDAGLISKNNFLSEKSSLDTARVTLMQSTRKLSEMLDKMDNGDVADLSQLTLAKFDKVQQALTGKHDRIVLKAPASGVLLYPPKSGEEKVEKLTVGSSVKAGQVFALVGDLAGISIEIDVPEVDIDKIKPGMKASITGVALGRHSLQGELVAVNAQASSNSGSALPSFSALVEVKQLTAEQQPLIKVGMSAAIALKVEEDKHLFVPIKAVKQINGNSVVKVREANGKLVERQVTTGAALADKVVIESGLVAGDEVAYDG